VPDVALISPYPREGRHAGSSGVASYAANLRDALEAHGARVGVIVPGPADEMDDDQGLRWLRAGPDFLPRAARAAARSGADVVHLQHEFFLYGGPAALPGLAAALAYLRMSGRGPIVTMHHGVEPATIDAEFMRLHRVRAPARVGRLGLGTVQAAVRRLARRVIVHEPLFAQWIGGAAVVPHGIEIVDAPSPAPAEARRMLGLDERPLALCLGFVAPYKGLEVALDAARGTERFQLVVAGADHPRLRDDDYGARLRESYDGVAAFPGHIPDADLPLWLAAADVMLFLYPHVFSSSGVLALALAHGRPVLMSPALGAAAGAPADVIVELDPRAVAGAIDETVHEPGRREAVMSGSRGLAAGRAWPDVARRHLRIYEEVAHADGTDRRLVRAA
jgi:glycosyltransferase involved in cell wall biosynthesis